MSNDGSGDCSDHSEVESSSAGLPKDKPTTSFIEGAATIAFSEKSTAFYNPVQEFNRDLTVLVLRQFVEDRAAEVKNRKDDVGDGPPVPKRKRTAFSSEDESVRILDALSASGLRALRFAKEVPNVAEVLANDFSEDSVEAMKQNIEINGVQNIVKPHFGDAVETMMAHRALDKRFHAIDLDPYGSASVFLDSAVQAVADRGILMITCTDMAVLCGNTPEACYNKYGSVGLRHKCCHEFAIRILLKAVDSHANRYARYIEPLLSISVDFYVRVFVRLHSGAHIAKESVTNVSNVFACTGCQSMQIQPLAKKTAAGASVKFTAATVAPGLVDAQGKCVYCGSSVHIAGPIYSAPIHNRQFVNSVLARLQETDEEKRFKTHNRLLGVLSVVAEELMDVPLYYEHDQLLRTVKSPVPKILVTRSAIINAGYRCSISHCNPRALKTDAPLSFLWDIVRTVAQNNKIFPSRFEDDSPGRKVLEAPITHTVNLRVHPEAQSKSKTDCLLRFQCNKGKNWGPKNKAKGSVKSVKAGFQVRPEMHAD